MARRACGVDQGEDGIGVAVVAQCPHRLHVARRLALVPELPPRTAVEPGLARVDRALERLAVHICPRQSLAGEPVLDDARDQAVGVEADFVWSNHPGDSMDAI